MKKKNTLLSVILTGSLAIGSLLSSTAYAEVGGAMGLSTMYLWRGKDVSSSAPQISGGLDYKHGSGLYASMWTSSESPLNSYEQDIWVGFAKEFSGIGIDVSLWEIMYPESMDKLFDTDGQELAISASYMDFSLTFVLNLDFDGSDDYKYISADYEYMNIGAHAGFTVTSDSANNYSDFNLSYALTDAASVLVSMAIGDGVTEAQKNPLVVFSYEIPFEFK